MRLDPGKRPWHCRHVDCDEPAERLLSLCHFHWHRFHGLVLRLDDMSARQLEDHA